MESLAPITDYLLRAEAIAEQKGYRTPELHAGAVRQMLLILAGGISELFGADADSPTWLPYFPYYLPRSAPNPDTIMGYVPIDPAGVYRISGVRGTETIAAITVRLGGVHTGRRAGRRLDEIDLMEVPVDADDRFDFLLSAERPKDHAGHWEKLDARATMLTLRRVVLDADQVDGNCVIERIDRTAGPLAPDPAAIAAKIAALTEFIQDQNEFLMGYVEYLRERGAEQALIIDDQTEYGGLIVQVYYFHLWSIADDEAIILESAVPDARYWNVQLWDPFCTTLDYVSRQTALNKAQARVDADGRVRMVIAKSDPGVANWLDTSGWSEGGLIWRWNNAASAPDPVARKVKLASLRDHLPGDTGWADEAERGRALAERATFYQSRRRQ